MRVALTVAGSDSGGGAGIQADLKTFHQFGVYGTTVIVAITAQNTMRVSAIHPVPAELVTAQFEALAEDLRPYAFKSGMLATEELVRTVAGAITRHGLSNYVLDPVMVASSGDRLLTAPAESAVREALLPLAAVVTPNLHEAEILTGSPVRSSADMEQAGRTLITLGARAALIKGGHLEGAEVIDVLVEAGSTRRFSHPKLRTSSTHGTGCTLSAAITAGLAHGRDLVTAVTDGLEYVHRAIAAAPGLGAGHGPLNHWVRADSGSGGPAGSG